MYCPNCNKESNNEGSFCCYCGSKLIEKPEHNCVVCGNDYEESQVYCKHCGHRLELAKDVSYRDYTAGLDTDTADTAQTNANTLNNLSEPMVNQAVPDQHPNMYQMPIMQQQPVYQPMQNQMQQQSNQLIAVSPTVTWYKGNKTLGYSTTNGKLNLFPDRIEFSSTFSANIFSSDARSKVFNFNEVLGIAKGNYALGSSILITLKTGQQHTYSSTNKALMSFLDSALEQFNRYTSK